MTLEAWVERPLRVVQDLPKIGGTYEDACLMISGLMSAISSFVWPGITGDRAKFIESWVRFSAPVADANWVSLPLLRKHLRAKRKFGEARLIEERRPNEFGSPFNASVLHGHHVDGDEAMMHAEYPSLPLDLFRKFAYPTIFYTQVRCKIVHEGELNGDAVNHAWTEFSNGSGVSYANRNVIRIGDNGQPVKLLPRERDRRIYFNMLWLIKLTRTLARNADKLVEEHKGEVPKPKTWWIAEHSTRPATTVTVRVGKKANIPSGALNVGVDSVDARSSPPTATLTFGFPQS